MSDVKELYLIKKLSEAAAALERLSAERDEAMEALRLGAGYDAMLAERPK